MDSWLRPRTPLKGKPTGKKWRPLQHDGHGTLSSLLLPLPRSDFPSEEHNALQTTLNPLISILPASLTCVHYHMGLIVQPLSFSSLYFHSLFRQGFVRPHHNNIIVSADPEDLIAKMRAFVRECRTQDIITYST